MQKQTRAGCNQLLAVCLGLTALLGTGCGTTYMKGTPLYTGEYSQPQGPPEERINLWPLAYYHEPALSVLWPLGEKTDDHVALRPLFSVYKLDRDEHEYNVLWPIGQFDFDTSDHRIFPFFWSGTDSRDKYFVAFPEVWWFEDAKAILPFIWWDEGFSVFPLAWYQKDEFFHVFPLWLDSEGAGGRDTHVLWPIFRRQNETHRKGFRVWPLLGHYKDSDGSTRDYALWPLCHRFRDDKNDETTKIAFPLYLQHTDGDDGFWLTPLALLPLYYQSRDAASETERFLTPLVGRSKSPDASQWYVLPLLSSVAWGEGKKEVWMLAPVSRFRWGDGKVQNHVFPLYAYDRERKMLLTPLVSWQNDKQDRFLNLLGLLAHYSRTASDRRAFYVLPPLTGAQWRKDGDLTHLRMLPIFSWSGEGERESLWIAPWMHFESSPNHGENSFFPIWSYDRHLWNIKGQRRQSVDFRLLGWLYDYRSRQTAPTAIAMDTQEEYVRARILWRLMHYERIKDRRSLDLFPFITYDRDKGSEFKKISFVWRLFRYERDRAGNVDMDVLFFPLRRRAQSEKNTSASDGAP